MLLRNVRELLLDGWTIYTGPAKVSILHHIHQSNPCPAAQQQTNNGGGIASSSTGDGGGARHGVDVVGARVRGGVQHDVPQGGGDRVQGDDGHPRQVAGPRRASAEALLRGLLRWRLRGVHPAGLHPWEQGGEGLAAEQGSERVRGGGRRQGQARRRLPRHRLLRRHPRPRCPRRRAPDERAVHPTSDRSERWQQLSRRRCGRQLPCPGRHHHRPPRHLRQVQLHRQGPCRPLRRAHDRQGPLLRLLHPPLQQRRPHARRQLHDGAPRAVQGRRRGHPRRPRPPNPHHLRHRLLQAGGGAAGPPRHRRCAPPQRRHQGLRPPPGQRHLQRRLLRRLHRLLRQHEQDRRALALPWRGQAQVLRCQPAIAVIALILHRLHARHLARRLASLHPRGGPLAAVLTDRSINLKHFICMRANWTNCTALFVRSFVVISGFVLHNPKTCLIFL